jgi:tetratricopeptide (TPR) repeat protein
MPTNIFFRGKFKALPSLFPKILALCLLALLAGACLTTKSSKAPAIRGLSASEADRLETLHDPSWRNSKSVDPAKADSPVNLAEMAEIFMQNGDYERSVLNYSKILAQEPERFDIRYKLGLALFLSGKLAEAKKELAEVLLRKSDMLEAHEALGVVFLQENNPAGAQQEFRAALALDPNRFQSRYFLGETCLLIQQYTQALAEFKAALALTPSSARVMGALGWTCFKLKNYDQALTWLQKAQAVNPADPKLNHRLGMVLATQKKFPEALAAFRKGGDEAQAFNNIGVYYYLEQRYAEAARCFQKALELKSTFYQEAKVNLDKALARLQQENTASQDLPGQKPGELSLSKKSPTTNEN